MNDLRDTGETIDGVVVVPLRRIPDERGTIFYTMKPCRYLDVDTRQCRIYEKRFAINPECVKLTPELVSTLRWLPRDCGYVAQPPLDIPPPVPRRRRAGRRKQM